MGRKWGLFCVWSHSCPRVHRYKYSYTYICARDRNLKLHGSLIGDNRKSEILILSSLTTLLWSSRQLMQDEREATLQSGDWTRWPWSQSRQMSQEGTTVGNLTVC